MGNYDPNAIATARQQLIKLPLFDGHFAEKSGGEVTAETSRARDGGKTRPEVLAGPSETGNVVIRRPYRPGPHRAKMKMLAGQVGRYRDTLSVWDTDPDLGPVGDPLVYANALLVRLAWPEGDANSSDPSHIELEFAVEEGV